MDGLIEHDLASGKLKGRHESKRLQDMRKAVQTLLALKSFREADRATAAFREQEELEEREWQIKARASAQTRLNRLQRELALAEARAHRQSKTMEDQFASRCAHLDARLQEKTVVLKKMISMKSAAARAKGAAVAKKAISTATGSARLRPWMQRALEELVAAARGSEGPLE